MFLVLRLHVTCQVDNAIGIPPFVIVPIIERSRNYHKIIELPGDELHEFVSQRNTSLFVHKVIAKQRRSESYLGIENGGAGIVDKIRRNNLSASDTTKERKSRENNYLVFSVA